MTRGLVANLVTDLQREVDLLLAHTDRTHVMASLLDGSADRDLYIGFLVQTRHYVARTYPTLVDAGKRMRALGRYPKLAALLEQKADEEHGHEVLIDNDFKALGADPAATMAATGPNHWIRTYNAWSAAMSTGQHPIGVLGSAYVLEALSIHRAKPMADGLRDAGKIDGIAGAVSFLDLHAEADVAHVADMDAILNDIGDADEDEAILLTAQMTRTAYVGQLEAVGESLKA